ncbi:bile acid-coenzyme A ligase [Micromonospora haikouensis]|uniref:Bile acid-coenzyme A ligase n=1 Tax=Micromonospora haikouensis TaxID=686309 RepID=A0A1C4XGL4_9ACTN|nr:class I adenylate-forming enzyme family protein [Micromonospora haikouensis]SCF07613.1 bile acid-coenzyme A ligase [Micromonospora haikouensis]
MSIPTTTRADLVGRIAELARTCPDTVAFAVAAPDGRLESLTYAELFATSCRFRDHLRELGAGPEMLVVLDLDNEPLYLSYLFGTWMHGGAVLPVSTTLPAPDKRSLLGLVETAIGPTLVVDAAASAGLRESLRTGPVTPPGESPGDGEGATPYLYLTSGGSTGLPKVVSYTFRGVGRSSSPHATGGREPVGLDGTRLVCGDLHSTGKLTLALHVVLTGCRVVTMRDFAVDTVTAVLREQTVYSLCLSPFHMGRILVHPDLDTAAYRRLGRVSHGGTHCPQWVKRGWIGLVGAKRVHEVYSSSEVGGSARPIMCDGQEWLRRPGTVGLGQGIRILDEQGADVKPGTIGEVFVAQTTGRANYYVGSSELRAAADDPTYVSVADLGWLDEDGYLFIADRLSETLRIDGQTVYPSMVEEAIGEHPLVADVAVVGVVDGTGQLRLHAVVEPVPGAAGRLDATAVLDHCRQRLDEVRFPRVVQFTERLPRTREGKMRRSVVREIAAR